MNPGYAAVAAGCAVILYGGLAHSAVAAAAGGVVIFLAIVVFGQVDR